VFHVPEKDEPKTEEKTQGKKRNLGHPQKKPGGKAGLPTGSGKFRPATTRMKSTADIRGRWPNLLERG